jgi:hypothetical protein
MEEYKKWLAQQKPESWTIQPWRAPKIDSMAKATVDTMPKLAANIKK